MPGHKHLVKSPVELPHGHQTVIHPPVIAGESGHYPHSATGQVGQAFHAFHGTWIGHIGTFHHWTALVLFAVGTIVVLGVAKSWAEDRVAAGHETSTAGLNYVVGPMGSGKSMFGVRAIVAAVTSGKYAVTNVHLYERGHAKCPEGWAWHVVKRKYGREFRDPIKRAAAIARLEGLYVYEEGLRTAMRYRVPCIRCGGDLKRCGHSGPEQEGRAVFVWDETHNDLNNRDYQGHGADREQREAEKERRRLIVRWATQLRKLGFSGFLLSQHHENTDAQLRRVCNHLIRLQNQRKVEGLWVLKLLPQRLTLFLVYWYPAHLADGRNENQLKPNRRERYWLPWCRHLYDSWETFAGIDALDDADSPILLPAGGRPSPETAIALESGPVGVAPGAPAVAGDGATRAAAALALSLENGHVFGDDGVPSPSQKTDLLPAPGGAEATAEEGAGVRGVPAASVSPEPLGDSGALAASSG